MSEELSDKAIYLLDHAVQSVFSRLGFVILHGPADRYGVIEWAANIPKLSPFDGYSLDLADVAVDVSIAAWHPDELAEELAATVQVTLGVRSAAYFTRWRFKPTALVNLEDQAASEAALSEAVERVYTSKRTLSAIQAVLSPENAPSDMTVLPTPSGAQTHSVGLIR